MCQAKPRGRCSHHSGVKMETAINDVNVTAGEIKKMWTADGGDPEVPLNKMASQYPILQARLASKLRTQDQATVDYYETEAGLQKGIVQLRTLTRSLQAARLDEHDLATGNSETKNLQEQVSRQQQLIQKANIQRGTRQAVMSMDSIYEENQKAVDFSQDEEVIELQRIIKEEIVGEGAPTDNAMKNLTDLSWSYARKMEVIRERSKAFADDIDTDISLGYVDSVKISQWQMLKTLEAQTNYKLSVVLDSIPDE